MQISLNGKWGLKYRAQKRNQGWKHIEAEVPGNVERDLMRHGILPDLTKGSNVYKAIEFETYEWVYSKEFKTPQILPGEKLYLIFEGIDCFASIQINGQHIGFADNMLIAHRFDISKWLDKQGTNLLEIHISSAVLEGRKQTFSPSDYAFEGNWESLHTRKAPHMFGWDIAPRIVSAGLWREVYLTKIKATHFTEIYWGTIQVDVENKSAKLMLDWNFETDIINIYKLKLAITIKRLAKTVYTSVKPVLNIHGREFIDLKDVDFWWPRGWGKPDRYNVTVALLNEAEEIIAKSEENIGIRTIKLKRTEMTSDAKDGDFSFIVNGEKIFIKGTNWVALDALHSRDRGHLERTFNMALDLNCNMLRCWGGNVYEDHDFFELCDKHGIMVWQDFALACAIYPQHKKFLLRIQKEVEFIVKKIRNHPSLALWAGNNEIDCAYNDWSQLQRDPNIYDKISRKVIPKIVSDLDPLRDYLPSSPYYSPELIKKGVPHNMKPEDHLWGPRDNFKGEFYHSSNAHFVSEIGYHGCPGLATMRKMLEAEYLWPWLDNDQWNTKAVRPLPQQTVYNYRIPLMVKQIEILFDHVPANIEDFILASQISQAEALKFFIEKWRSEKWERSGILWWNLKDCWPIISDAIVDYYYRKKLAYYYVKRVQTDICSIVTEMEDDMHKVIIINDTAHRASGHIILKNGENNKNLLEQDFTINANGKIEVGNILAVHSPELWLVETVVDSKNESLRNHYIAGKRPFELNKYKKWLRILKRDTNKRKEFVYEA